MQFFYNSSPLQALHSHFFPDLQVWIKRDDLLHPDVSGNKLRKLKFPLLALKASAPTLITMGGAWSNHLHATAHAASLAGFASIALVRGHYAADQVLTPTLEDCRRLGMQIRFVTREQYRALRDEPAAWQAHIDLAPEQCAWLPEGGSSPMALYGVAELIDELPFVPETLIVACGTGATLAGLLAGMRGRGRVLGIAAIKNADYLHGDIGRLLEQAGYPRYKNYELLTQFDHGGYAKAPPLLQQFCQEFSAGSTIPVEPVYTGKMFYALHQLALSGKFTAGERVVAVHTGGLQGARGFAQKNPGSGISDCEHH
jgi:1-aminocyclopropane-1-carboxylate deaminase